MMQSVRHIGIVVGDLKKAIRFYKDTFGLRIRKEALESGEYIDTILGIKGVNVRTVKMIASNGDLIELLSYKSHPEKSLGKKICDMGYSHIAFTIDDIEREYRRLKKKGVEFNSSPQLSPDGKATVVFCRDMEGNFIELVQEG